MELTVSKEKLEKIVLTQLENLFLYSADISSFMKTVLVKCENCFAESNNKYYLKDKEVLFSPYHSGQYSIFLYYLANTIWKETGNKELCSTIYYLNKCLNAVDWFYEIELPDIFDVEHPVGTVMGRGQYSNRFIFYQGCTVGGSINGGITYYPKMGEYLTMYANSTILGDCIIGANCVLAARALVKNQDVPPNSIVYGESPNLIIKEKNEGEMRMFAEDAWKFKDDNR